VTVRERRDGEVIVRPYPPLRHWAAFGKHRSLPFDPRISARCSFVSWRKVHTGACRPADAPPLHRDVTLRVSPTTIFSNTPLHVKIRGGGCDGCVDDCLPRDPSRSFQRHRDGRGELREIAGRSEPHAMPCLRPGARLDPRSCPAVRKAVEAGRLRRLRAARPSWCGAAVAAQTTRWNQLPLQTCWNQLPLQTLCNVRFVLCESGPGERRNLGSRTRSGLSFNSSAPLVEMERSRPGWPLMFMDRELMEP
jgi:hypothetical protein